MNFFDKEFYNLINEFKTKSIINLYTHSLQKFKSCSIGMQKSFEKFFNQFPYWGKLDIQSENYEFIYLKAKTFKKHHKDYVWLYETLSDFKSKRILYSILNNFYNFNFEDLKTVKDKLHYFDLDLLPSIKNMIIVDVGAYTGDTVLDCIKTYNENYKKFYCFEITPSVCNDLENNLKDYKNIIIKNKAVSDKIETLFLKENSHASGNQITNAGDLPLQSTTLDLEIKEKIDLIKMDIEGAEEKALLGSIEHIKKDKPILLISVYHNNKDLYKLPQIIKALNQGYKLYLRYYGGPYYATEIVLFAIPN